MTTSLQCLKLMFIESNTKLLNSSVANIYGGQNKKTKSLFRFTLTIHYPMSTRFELIAESLHFKYRLRLSATHTNLDV